MHHLACQSTSCLQLLYTLIIGLLLTWIPQKSMIIIFEFPSGKNLNRKMDTSHMYVSEGNRHSLQAQLVPECCSMRNLDCNQPAAGSSSISDKKQGAENAFSAVRLLRSRDQRNLTCVPNCIAEITCRQFFQ